MGVACVVIDKWVWLVEW